MIGTTKVEAVLQQMFKPSLEWAKSLKCGTTKTAAELLYSFGDIQKLDGK